MDSFIGKQFEVESDLESLTSDILYQGRSEGAGGVSGISTPRFGTPGMNPRANATSNTYNYTQSSQSQMMRNAPYMTPYDESELPEYACSYCGIHSPGCVAKCVTCNKWFCNSRGNTTSSHLVTHLVRARHKQVMLHPESELGDTTLECYNCGNQNVFLLGFISAKSETVVVILCRHPCASAGSAGDVNWDTNDWHPLIDDRSFLSWLVCVPTEKEELRSRHISAAQIAKLEDIWRINATAKLEDLTLAKENEEIIPEIGCRFDDGYLYQRSFGPVVKAEAEYDKQLRESQTQTDVDVTWDMGLSKRHLVTFVLSKVDLADIKVTVGDEVRLHFKRTFDSWIGSGYVIKRSDAAADEITIELDPHGPPPPTDKTSGFQVEFVWNNVTYDRVQKALKVFAEEDTSVSGYIYHKLLGHDIDSVELDVEPPRSLSVPGIAELNPVQQDAVRSVLKLPLSLIQGPPGTGKTVVSTTIAYHLAKMTQEQVLACAPSNVVTDQLAERLEKTGLKVVRVAARVREHMDSRVEHLTLHSRVAATGPSELRKLMELKNELGELSASDEKRYVRLLRDTERKILRSADVICSTCSGAGGSRLRGMRFRSVLIDESTQATEPECLIPVVNGCKQLILIGDHQQLGPVISNRKAARAGLSRSLFERLILLRHRPIRLTVQYRMHPCLSLFPSNMFYDGSLQNGVTVQDRRGVAGLPWPIPETPMMFWASFGQEEISATGVSYLNRSEAVACQKLITRMYKSGVKPSQIGIVTPYEGQRTYLKQYLTTVGDMDAETYGEIEIESVDAFQGREKDYIILSCVRSNDHQGIGFLSDKRRMNVAITRAKYGLVILGNPRVLSKNILWSYLLNHFKERGCLVEGALGHLQKCTVPLLKPRAPQRFNELRPDGGAAVGGYPRAQHFNDRFTSTPSMTETSSVVSYNDDIIAEPISKSIPVVFGQQFDALDDWREGPSDDQRAIGHSLSERIIQQKEYDDEDDDVQSISTSFASQMGLY